MTDENATPTAAGYTMPAEWESHAGCLMSWPSRAELWRDRLAEAKRDYAAVAAAIAPFEPVVMACNPGDAAEVRNMCGHGITPFEVPINDSWSRDNGPIFVRNPAGEVAVVGFGFNAWGDRWQTYDDDARLPQRVAGWLGLRFFRAPFVLEGGSFFVDGEGTVITTEQCLLNPNRNPQLSRAGIEQGLKDFLGAATVIWLPYGHSLDVGPEGTDGHVDVVLQYTSPARVLVEAPSEPTSSEFERGRANVERLRASRDAAGRPFDIEILDPGSHAKVPYANHYLANGAVIVPLGGTESDVSALDTLRDVYHDRKVVGVPGDVIAFGGGGPHCITQQIPAGVELPVA
jgi:agmatine deiminase